MAESLFSPSWYRVAHLTPRLRKHAQILRHEYRSQTWYVLQDLTSERFRPGAVDHASERHDPTSRPGRLEPSRALDLQGTARRECVGVFRHSRHSLAVSHTPQSIDQVIILHMVRRLAIHDYDLMVCRVDTRDSSLEKLYTRSTQNLRKRASLDHLIGGKLR